MSVKTLVRSLAVLSLGVSVSAASATTIYLSSVGSYTVSGATGTFSERVIYNATNPSLAPFTSLTYVLGSSGGTAIYKNAADTQELDISLKVINYNVNSPFVTVEETWTYLGGKGDYAGLAGGYGTVTTNVNTDDQSSLTTLKGRLDAVPEPSGLAAIGFGMIALITRRRRG